MAESKILETDQSHATANSTLQLSPGTYQPKWIHYEETGLDDYLRDNGFSIFDIRLSVKLGHYDIYEVLVDKNSIKNLGKLFDLHEPFHKDSPLVHEEGEVEALRITYHAYKAKKAEGLSPAEEAAWNCRVEQHFKPRLPELDMETLKLVELNVKMEQQVDPMEIIRFFPIPIINNLRKDSTLRYFPRWKNEILRIRRDLDKESIVNGLKRDGYRIMIKSTNLSLDHFKAYLETSSTLYMADAYREPQVQLLCDQVIQELEWSKATVSLEFASFVHAEGGESSATNAPLSSGDQTFQYQINPTLAHYIVQYPQQYYSLSQPYLNPYNIGPPMSVTQYPPSTETIDSVTTINGIRGINNFDQQETSLDTLETYRQSIISALSLTREGQLENASILLRQWTGWLIKNAKDLGLHLDDPTRIVEYRILWQNLNFSWLALFQKQWDVMSGSVEWRASIIGEKLLFCGICKSATLKMVKRLAEPSQSLSNARHAQENCFETPDYSEVNRAQMAFPNANLFGLPWDEGVSSQTGNNENEASMNEGVPADKVTSSPSGQPAQIVQEISAHQPQPVHHADLEYPPAAQPMMPNLYIHGGFSGKALRMQILYKAIQRFFLSITSSAELSAKRASRDTPSRAANTMAPAASFA
ncbi:hypothetical protein PISL3812_09809 [Talaromyces islandicus]|uniref:Uncharacterized protein n=1 Tax=Talaromyces islandicus TaxID=28573 RepID=A0A0U1MBP3_TALIS|nr:hypothetical protein PISL3812_09809 [Talaromyces islandicus]